MLTNVQFTVGSTDNGRTGKRDAKLATLPDIYRWPNASYNLQGQIKGLNVSFARLKQYKSKRRCHTDCNRRPTGHPTITICTKKIILVPPLLGRICQPFSLADRSFNLPLGNFEKSRAHLEAITAIVPIWPYRANPRSYTESLLLSKLTDFS